MEEFIDRLTRGLNTIRAAKTDILGIQSSLVDYEGYNEDMDGVFEDIDYSLHVAKDEIEELIKLIQKNNA